MELTKSLYVTDGKNGTLNTGIIPACLSPLSWDGDYATSGSVILNDGDAPSGPRTTMLQLISN